MIINHFPARDHSNPNYSKYEQAYSKAIICSPQHNPRFWEDVSDILLSDPTWEMPEDMKDTEFGRFWTQYKQSWEAQAKKKWEARHN